MLRIVALIYILCFTSHEGFASHIIPPFHAAALPTQAWTLVAPRTHVALTNGWTLGTLGRFAAHAAVTNHLGRPALRLQNFDRESIHLVQDVDAQGKPLYLRPFRRYRAVVVYAAEPGSDAFMGVWPQHSLGPIAPPADQFDPTIGHGRHSLAPHGWQSREITFASGRAGPFRICLSLRGVGPALLIGECSVIDEGPAIVETYQTGYAPPYDPIALQWFNAARLAPLEWDTASESNARGGLGPGWTFFVFEPTMRARLFSTNHLGSEALAFANIDGPHFGNLMANGFPTAAPILLEPGTQYTVSIEYATGSPATRPHLRINADHQRQRDIELPDTGSAWKRVHTSFEVDQPARASLVFATRSNKPGAILYLRSVQLSAVR